MFNLIWDIDGSTNSVKRFVDESEKEIERWVEQQVYIQKKRASWCYLIVILELFKLVNLNSS